MLDQLAKERGIAVRCILTKAAREFITALSAGALSGERAYTDLFDPAVELDIGHIRLAREADLIVVAPATADLMAKMAAGTADDLASAVLLGWYRAGVDVAAHLPLLTTFLGHSTPADTYWYLSAVPELLSLAAERRERTLRRPA